jgi:hypothetical protein
MTQLSVVSEVSVNVFLSHSLSLAFSPSLSLTVSPYLLLYLFLNLTRSLLTLGIILQLAEEDVLPSEAADLLLVLVRDSDTRIIALYNAFQSEHDANGLINALIKLAVAEIQSQLQVLL